MRFGSVCSGIEAASVAWAPLGWEAAWLSEIEAFPSAVLAHHWPDVPNLGDMTALPERVATGETEAPDVLVGGTPCQAFSVAGRRESLADARGNLTLTYVELADAIDEQRGERGEQPAIIVWENVPGVLNTKDNAFGCFLAGLAGEDVPLQPPGKRWTNAGLVLGPKRAVAWRILDAQYFGLAQRRRRVFVVASARDGFDPSQVLLEFDGLRRDTAPRREARQETPGDAGPGTTGASHWDAVTNPHPTLNQSQNTGGIGASNQEVFSQRGSGLIPTPYQDVAHCLNAGGMGRIDYETESFVVDAAIPILEPGARTGKSTTDVRAGLGVGDDGDPMFTLQAGKQHGVAFAQNTRDEVRLIGGDKPHVLATMEVAGTMKACAGTSVGWSNSADHAAAGYMQVDHNLAVRRLTPTECERLQGFPDGHTDVPYRKKPAADGPRYKALGNSMAVPVMAWIGRRIANYVA